MRILGTLCALTLFLFLIAPATGYSQERDENKPQAQDEQKPKDNNRANENRQEDRKATPNEGKRQEDRNARPDEGRREPAPNADRRDERQNQPEANRPEQQQKHDEHQGQEQRPMNDDNRRAQDMNRDHNQHRAGDHGRRIPDDQFRSHFGRQHTFHVERQQIVNVSQPVVVYRGYSFQLIDAWPSDWSYDDDCYVDDVDGEYFLYDVMHPGIRIAVFVIG